MRRGQASFGDVSVIPKRNGVLYFGGLDGRSIVRMHRG